MNQEPKAPSRTHDLFSAFLGGFAAVCLITSPWNVDTEGPDPFYMGPLIFPVMVLTMMILAALPACVRLLFPPADSTWRLDGEGYPQKTLVVPGLLIAALVGLNLIGLDIVPVCLGLFGVGQTLLLVERKILLTDQMNLTRSTLDFSKLLLTLRYWKTLIRSGVIGTFVGLLPGTGSILASFMSYEAARRLLQTSAGFRQRHIGRLPGCRSRQQCGACRCLDSASHPGDTG